MNGKGKYYYNKGNIYEGEIKDNKYNGNYCNFINKLN